MRKRKLRHARALTYIIRETPSLRCLADEVGGKVVVAVL
jgi:hypothetical protein